MGEAKRRGTYEQRKAAAITKKQEIYIVDQIVRQEKEWRDIDLLGYLLDEFFLQKDPKAERPVFLD